jgi:hypothetical protein
VSLAVEGEATLEEAVLIIARYHLHISPLTLNLFGFRQDPLGIHSLLPHHCPLPPSHLTSDLSPSTSSASDRSLLAFIALWTPYRVDDPKRYFCGSGSYLQISYPNPDPDLFADSIMNEAR